MTTVSDSIPNLLGGVSQQPAPIRLENAATDLRNAMLSVVSGLRKRPNIHHTAVLPITLAGGQTIRHYLWEREDDTRSRHVIIHNRQLYVFRLDGTQESVVNLGAAYLNTDDPEKDIGVYPLGDTLWVYNRTKVVTLNSAASPLGPVMHQAPGLRWSIVVTAAQGYIRFEVLNPYGAALYTEVEPANTEGPTDVAQKITTAIAANYTGATVTRIGNTVCVFYPTGVESLSATPAALTVSYGDEISRFTSLPVGEIDGRRVLVRESADSDGYYVRFNGVTQRWRETYGPNAWEELLPSTMPHILVDQGDGTWQFQPHTWEPRRVGDASSNSTPSFVGQPVQDLFLAGDRMCFLSGDAMTCSAVGDYEQFYRTTVVSKREDDRLDFTVSSPGDPSASLLFAMPFDESILIFSKRGQYRLDVQALASGSFSAKPTTSYRVSPLCRPVGIGASIVFTDEADNSAWAKLREYQVDEAVARDGSDFITRQVPNYIPSGIHRIATSTSIDTAAVLTRGDRTRMFVYNYFDSEEGRVQSAWNAWAASNTFFVSAAVSGSRLLLLMTRGPQVHLGYIVMDEPNGIGDFQGAEILLDHRVPETRCSVAATGSGSRITLPFPAYTFDTPYVVLRADVGQYQQGETFVGTVGPGGTVDVPEVDLTGASFFVGFGYAFRWELSPIYMRDTTRAVLLDGRFQLKSLEFAFTRTGPFRVSITPPGRETSVYQHTGRITGDLGNTAGAVPLTSGSFRVPSPMEGRNLRATVVNDGPLQCQFTSLDWRATWHPKTIRMRR